MAMLTVRNLPDDIHRALKLQAAKHGRSAEAEVREIIAQAVKPPSRLLMGDAMMQLARDAGITDADVDTLLQQQNNTPAQPLSLE